MTLACDPEPIGRIRARFMDTTLTVSIMVDALDVFKILVRKRLGGPKVIEADLGETTLCVGHAPLTQFERVG